MMIPKSKGVSLTDSVRNLNLHNDTDLFLSSDRDVRPDVSAAAVKLVVTRPQQQDQLHSGEHCRGERVVASAGYTLYV